MVPLSPFLLSMYFPTGPYYSLLAIPVDPYWSLLFPLCNPCKPPLVHRIPFAGQADLQQMLAEEM